MVGLQKDTQTKALLPICTRKYFFFPCLNQPTEAETPSVDINNAVPRRDLIPAVFEQLTRDYVCLPTRERALRPASTHPLGFPS